MLTLGSFFNGISTWIYSAEKAGIKTIWESEIDPYCEAVTAHHYPDVKQLGDITKLTAADLEPVDIITDSSPCQDLSISGKRKGLAGERSGLFINSIKLVHELRKRTGKPRYFVWENVPGALTSNKGFDFRAIIEEICQTEIPMPYGGKWAEAGMVEWGGSQLAWRCMDSQFWGSAQRRKRVFLVASFGTRTAAEILFERNSSKGDSPQGEGTREEVTTSARTSIDRASQGLIVFEDRHDEGVRFMTGGKTNTLTAAMGMGGNNMPMIQTFPQQAFDEYGEGKPLSTLKAKGGSYGGGSESLVYQKKVGALCMDDYKGANNQYVDQDKCVVQSGVRRLTPLEAERLQNLPDGWTDVEYNSKPAPDSKRYKALGNGIAAVNSDWIMKRIAEVANGQNEGHD